APRRSEVTDRKADGIASLDAGEARHDAIPDHDIGVGAESAYALREIFENLPKISLKGLELGGCAAKGYASLVEPLLEQAELIGQRRARARVHAQALVDDHAREPRPHEPGQVALDAIAQEAQLDGSSLVEPHHEIAEGSLDFDLCGAAENGHEATLE